MRPERRRPTLTSFKHSGRGPQRRVRVEHVTRQALEEVGFVGVDAEMVKLHLRLRPREGDGALEGCRIVMFVGQVEHFAARGRDQRPECDRAPWPQAQA